MKIYKNSNNMHAVCKIIDIKSNFIILLHKQSKFSTELELQWW
jgi:hypothetical protein